MAEGEKADADAKKAKARSRGVNSVGEIEKAALQVRAEKAEAALAQMQVLAIGGDQALGAQWQAEAAHAKEVFKQALQYKPAVGFQQALQQQLALQPTAQVNVVLPSPALTFRQELAAMGVNTVPQVVQQQPQVQQQQIPAASLTEVQALQQQVEQRMQVQQQGQNQGGYNSRNNGSSRGNGGGGGGGFNSRRNNWGGNYNRQNQNSVARGACFECGSTDHQVSRCPQRQQFGQQFGQQQQQQQFGQQQWHFTQQQRPMQQFVQQQPVQQLVQQQSVQQFVQQQQPRQQLPIQQMQLQPQTANYVPRG